MAVPQRSGVTYEDYLAVEASSDERHEYLRGELFAMAGGTARHAALAASVVRRLGNVLEGRPCFALGSDFRVRVEETDLSTYPDVSVWCGEIQRPAYDAHAGTNPVALVEVLSPSTRDYDVGAKARHYLRIPSLRHLVLVDTEAQQIELWTRGDGDTWEVRHVTSGALRLAHLDVTLDVDALYALPPGIG